MLLGPGVTEDTKEKINNAENVASVIASSFHHDLHSIRWLKKGFLQMFGIHTHIVVGVVGTSFGKTLF